jgi:hypothetical protein
MTEKLFKKLDIGFGWVAFLIATIVYLLTLEPTVSFWDCGEFTSTANKLEVGHPPGAPFFMLTARIFAMLALEPSQVSVMVNAFSAIASAFTIMFLYWTIAYFAKRMIAPNKNYTLANTIAIIGSSMIGALVYTFSDTFWFSAVEAEVYAFSSFFTAIVFWAILKWSETDDEKIASRWLLLIALLVGLSIGVHLLNLLTIPAIAFVIYYKKFNPSTKGFFITASVSLFVIAMIMWGIIPGVGIVASKLELLFINKFKLAYNTGLIIWALLTIISLGLSIYFTQYSKNMWLKTIFPLAALILIGAPFISGSIFVNVIIILAMGVGIFLLVYTNKDALLNLLITSITLIMIGYSTYAIIVIRSNANPPMDQNSPDDVFNLLYYLNREQYGDRPLVYGQYYTVHEINKKIDTKYNGPIYVKRNGRYEKAGYKSQNIYPKEYCTIFPRMYSHVPNHIDIYKSYGGIRNNRPPKFENNLRFFIDYQLNWMYWRYFMWNFAGRQNDMQGDGSSLHGNWISGLSFVDNPRLGNQDKLPNYLKNNKANNKYYMLPLLLGLLGLSYQLFKHLKDWWIVSLLFILTGIAIVVYLNQTPNQPRERDYAYAGSFYAFSIWVGLGLLAIYKMLRKFSPAVVAAVVATLICLPVPYIMAKENWDDHDRSNRYVARDVGYNYLMSCEPNAILFTQGDNDTFPIWYAQEVEGIRTDVKVCCLPYFNSDWYINQMKTQTYEAAPMPLSITRDKYESIIREGMYYIPAFISEKPENNDHISVDSLLSFVTSDRSILEMNKNMANYDPKSSNMYLYPKNKIFFTVNKENVLKYNIVSQEYADLIEDTLKVDMNKSILYRNEMMLLDMLRTNDWKRPVYFTSANSEHTVGLKNYLKNEGFVYKLVPVKSDIIDDLDTETLYNNLMNKCKWGNMGDPNVYIDQTIVRTTKVVDIRDNFKRLAINLVESGDLERAKKVMEKADSILSIANFPPTGGFDVYYADGWYLAEVPEKGDEYIRNILNNCVDNLKFFLSLDSYKQKLNSRFEESSIITIRMLMDRAKFFKREDLIKEVELKLLELE